MGSGAKRNPCVVTSDGGAGCFHDDLTVSFIRLGAGGPLINDAVAITNGEFGDQGNFCLVRKNGAVHCGTNGVATTTPVIASGALAVGRLGINGDYCAQMEDNTIRCGSPGGAPTTRISNTASPISSMGCYKEGCCAVLENGKIQCTTGNQDFLSSLGQVTFFSGGDNNKCAVYADGSAYCDGENWNGQLGIPGYDSQNHQNPTATFTSGMVASACGQHTACWLADSGKVYCSGAGSNEAGSGGGSRSPTVIKDQNGAEITNAVSITAGREFSCAALKTGELKCWGFGSAVARTVNLQGKSVYMPTECRE